MIVEAIEEHPAKWSKGVLTAVNAVVLARGPELGEPCRVLDPFAGTGGIHALALDGLIEVIGVELEPEWAVNHPDTRVGNALELPLGDRSVHVVATSPCFGNRMADHHEAADVCRACAGTGSVVVEIATVATGKVAYQRHATCPDCKGRGLTRRNTYRHVLGRKLSKESAAGLQWGEKYRAFHSEAIDEWERVLVPGGLAIVNMKNHIRGHREQRVVEWWLNELIVNGWAVVEVLDVVSVGNRFGANGDQRVESEAVIVVRSKAAE